MVTKPCPVCKSSKLKFVYYAPPANAAPDLWEFDEDGFSPLIWFKRIECKKCGATVPQLVMTEDQAIDYWNSIKDADTGARYVVQKIGEENVHNVESEEVSEDA